MGKAAEVPEAVRKGTEQARKGMIAIPLVKGSLPHDALGHYGAGEVLLKPAGKGTGVIAGGAVRAVLEQAGVRDVVTKCIGSNNPHNVVRATMDALKQLRTVEDVSARRGKTTEELRG
jgi:small subunit ribosomal protein S5